MTHAHPIYSDDGKTRGRAAARPCMGNGPASINHHKHRSADSPSVGSARFGSYRHTHACGHDWSGLSRAGLLSGFLQNRLTYLPLTCRGLHGSRPFFPFVNFAGLRRCNGSLRTFNAPQDSSRNCVQALPTHFKISVSCADNQAHEAPNAVHQSHEAGSSNDR